MAISNRSELKDYALRQLGHPLVTIDITDDAMEDRIDTALDFFHEYYFDGSNRFFYAHQVTQDDIDNGYITLPDHIWGVNTVFPFSNNSSTSPSIFDLQYQLRMHDLRDLTSTSLIYYSQIMSHIQLLDNVLTVGRQVRFNRNEGKLFIDMKWGDRVTVDSWLMVDCYSILDPDTNTKFWNNREFKKYVTAQFKLQWSMAYKKYDQIQLPGGVTINGAQFYAEAKSELQEIEEELKNNQAPLNWFVG